MPIKIKDAWEIYRKGIPSGAPRVQVDETRKAFYGGAMAIFVALTTGVSEGDEVKEEDMDMMSSLEKELEAFMKEQMS